MKQTLPPGTAKPPDSMLVEASLVFHQTSGAVDLRDYSQWWSWVKDASWKHPEGLNSSIKGKENCPVVLLKILKPSIQKGQRKATTR